MHILALNPFHGGSHKAFLEGWAKHSSHTFEIVGLPARKWKWRMRHAPVEFARKLDEFDLKQFDGLFTTDMLDLATFRGLTPAITSLPTVVYFHENQLMYPIRGSVESRERDMHFAFTNILTAATADAIWFNSTWHRESFIQSATSWMAKMPDYPPRHLIEAIECKASTQYPGVDLVGPAENPTPAPLTIAWVSRWEHDKNPTTFFDALRLLKESGVEFRLIVLGENYRKQPPCFESAKTEFANQILHIGFAPNRATYETMLKQADVVVSTAIHEFFGLAIVEAASAGCIPVVPDELAYPEVFKATPCVFHRNTPEDLCERLSRLAISKHGDGILNKQQQLSQHSSRFAWPTIAKSLDTNILSTVCDFGRGP